MVEKAEADSIQQANYQRSDSQVQQDERPSLGDRVRGIFNRPAQDDGQQEPDNQAWTDNQPPVPTA